MTFRCALRFEPDKAKGPGYGLILASCPGFSAAPNTLLYMIKDPSNSMSLGPNGWQPGDAHLVPDAVAPSGEILSLSVGPAVVDSLELQAIYQVVLFTDAEHVWQGGLSINRIVYSRDRSDRTQPLAGRARGEGIRDWRGKGKLSEEGPPTFPFPLQTARGARSTPILFKDFRLYRIPVARLPCGYRQAFPHRALKALKTGLGHPKAKIRFPPPKLLCFGGVCVFMGNTFSRNQPGEEGA